ncbi:MAG: GldG family protein [Clostridia bacterium]|nr:GldG family protein [Clostridia bacterium]
MNKKTINKKNMKFKINNVVVILLVISIVLLLNIVLSLAEDRLPKLKIDLTHDAITKVSSETKVFLKSLDETDTEVEIIYLKGTQDVTEETDTVLKQYDAYSANITYTQENYHTNPMVLEPFGISPNQIIEGTVVVTNEDRDRYRAILPTEMWSGAEFLLESKVTNAVAYLMSDESINVCIAVGYESDENYLDIVQTMIDDNITVSRVNLVDKNAYVPTEVDVLMLLVPYRDLDVAELYKIDDYILRGGNVVVALPFGMQLNNLESYLASWGVKVNNDVIYELDANSSYGDTGVAFYAQKGASSVTDTISGNVIASYARSMSYTPTGDIECTKLLSTSAESVSTPPVDATEVTAEDIAYGPFDIAYLLEKPLGENWENTGKILVTSTPSVWGVEGLAGVLSEARFGNREFVSNALSVLSEKEVKSVIVPRKLATENIMDISDSQAGLLNILLCVLLPLGVLTLGVIIWFKRRNK